MPLVNLDWQKFQYVKTGKLKSRGIPKLPRCKWRHWIPGCFTMFNV